MSSTTSSDHCLLNFISANFAAGVTVAPLCQTADDRSTDRNDGEIKSHNDWWLDGEESHTKDRTERAVESGRQKIQATGERGGESAKITLKIAGRSANQ
ncbi:hypothetical protein PPTG_23774 [Phytophthora nicotianae INRA-310]|uniref:Uncharacterized protein n=1 Tax=Phytophthora nicotianae (strain INRA-310) TaxID=761204 RepID=W2PS12_PHYN3|nr:hypothetical protein PPTG_23774 [Phytophthora nicotianae INRA-310]ETN03426.1 hypothetical protein PPTG_23774 [Phytophthora nicotianae INRA-310]